MVDEWWARLSSVAVVGQAEHPCLDNSTESSALTAAIETLQTQSNRSVQADSGCTVSIAAVSSTAYY